MQMQLISFAEPSFSSSTFLFSFFKKKTTIISVFTSREMAISLLHWFNCFYTIDRKKCFTLYIDYKHRFGKCEVIKSHMNSNKLIHCEIANKKEKNDHVLRLFMGCLLFNRYSGSIKCHLCITKMNWLYLMLQLFKYKITSSRRNIAMLASNVINGQ